MKKMKLDLGNILKNVTNIQIMNNIDRHHSRLQTKFDFLDIRVAKLHFQKIREFLEKSSLYFSNQWKMRLSEFPVVLIDVFTIKGDLAFILCINYRNYNFYPPQITILNNEYRAFLSISNNMVTLDKDGINHIIANPMGYAWICTRGTYMFHDFYYDLIDTSRYNTWERSLIGKIKHNEILVGHFKQRICKELGVQL
ncbi:hypothetical protein LCGC14_3098110, partial [marine sediment metagenome]